MSGTPFPKARPQAEKRAGGQGPTPSSSESRLLLCSRQAVMASGPCQVPGSGMANSMCVFLFPGPRTSLLCMPRGPCGGRKGFGQGSELPVDQSASPSHPSGAIFRLRPPPYIPVHICPLSSVCLSGFGYRSLHSSSFVAVTILLSHRVCPQGMVPAAPSGQNL